MFSHKLATLTEASKKYIERCIFLVTNVGVWVTAIFHY